MVKKPIHLEIERKYVLKRLPPAFKANCHKHLFIDQHYLFIDGIWQRFRIVTEAGKKGKKIVHTIKKRISAGIQEETERTITEKAFNKIFLNKELTQRKFIKKERYIMKYKKLKFEVDVYSEIRIVTLEVELSNLKQKIQFPPELDNTIIADVTHVKGFSNLSMAENIL